MGCFLESTTFYTANLKKKFLQKLRLFSNQIFLSTDEFHMLPKKKYLRVTKNRPFFPIVLRASLNFFRPFNVFVYIGITYMCMQIILFYK